MPPAVVKPPAEADDVVQINIRVRRVLADALADASAAQRVSQKVLICRVLAAGGYPVHPRDLEDQVVRSRRGTGVRR